MLVQSRSRLRASMDDEGPEAVAILVVLCCRSNAVRAMDQLQAWFWHVDSQIDGGRRRRSRSKRDWQADIRTTAPTYNVQCDEPVQW